LVPTGIGRLERRDDHEVCADRRGPRQGRSGAGNEPFPPVASVCAIDADDEQPRCGQNRDRVAVAIRRQVDELNRAVERSGRDCGPQQHTAGGELRELEPRRLLVLLDQRCDEHIADRIEG
jgi:hypothetical protein